MARLDTCYRTLAAAPAAPREDDQNAVLRDRICEYFEETTSTACGAGSEGACEDPPATQDAAVGVEGSAEDADPLSGLPLKKPPPALALDVRELLAFARRSGGSGRGGGSKGAPPEVRPLRWVSFCLLTTQRDQYIAGRVSRERQACERLSLRSSE